MSIKFLPTEEFLLKDIVAAIKRYNFYKSTSGGSKTSTDSTYIPFSDNPEIDEALENVQNLIERRVGI